MNPMISLHHEGPTNSLNLDPAVLAVFPAGTIFKAIDEHGVSLWTKTCKITTFLDNIEHCYFLKPFPSHKMAMGEYESILAIHSTSPGFCPRPVGQGKFDLREGYFFICEFLSMIPSSSPPSDPAEFCFTLAKMHRNGKSPNGKFGFHVPTYNGWLEQKNDWQETWEKFFTEGVKYLLVLEKEVNGPSTELDTLSQLLFESVIPRLLGQLTGKIEPCLIHGDLWWGNISEIQDEGRKKAIIFDPSGVYAHNEYELGIWVPPRNRLKEFISEYIKYFPPAEPVEEFEDRLKLYGMRTHLHCAILFPGTSHPLKFDFRQMVIADMRDLARKFSEKIL